MIFACTVDLNFCVNGECGWAWGLTQNSASQATGWEPAKVDVYQNGVIIASDVDDFCNSYHKTGDIAKFVFKPHPQVQIGIGGSNVYEWKVGVDPNPTFQVSSKQNIAYTRVTSNCIVDQNGNFVSKTDGINKGDKYSIRKATFDATSGQLNNFACIGREVSTSSTSYSEYQNGIYYWDGNRWTQKMTSSVLQPLEATETPATMNINGPRNYGSTVSLSSGLDWYKMHVNETTNLDVVPGAYYGLANFIDGHYYFFFADYNYPSRLDTESSINGDYMYFESCEDNYMTPIQYTKNSDGSTEQARIQQYSRYIGKINALVFYSNRTDYYAGEEFEVKNVKVFDLTLMFGAGNEPKTVDEFKQKVPNYRTVGTNVIMWS